jgi:HD-GYP domain-containing protein (c-di-GMP phosphodiesterase class II)
LGGGDDVTQSLFIDIQDVCIGMYIQLDIGWLRHPFPISSFRISSQEQIQALQSLGIRSIRCFPAKSDAEISAVLLSIAIADGEGTNLQPLRIPSAMLMPARAEEVGAQFQQQEPGEGLASARTERAALQVCNQRFTVAADGYRKVLDEVVRAPEQALQTSLRLVGDYITELLDSSQTTIRLLSESVGERQGAHPINVTVLSLLLGKAQGLDAASLMDLGLAALLHDVGKLDIDPRCAENLPSLTDAQRQSYEAHVGASVAYAQRMGLSARALTTIAQHHEAADGSGFPLHLLQEDLTVEGQILALTNCYDKLCNPVGLASAMTPHEALSVLFAQRRGGFAREFVELFVRVLGVYPPGSVVQLSDERYGMVVAVDSAQPLKPHVLLYQAEVAQDNAQPVALSQLPGVVIKRSLRPAQLPREVLDYLLPRKRVCYFFERAVPLMVQQGEAL